MSAKVLGRITPPTDRPRGPDVTMSLAVPQAWLVEGATLAIELPRNLVCASCDGGGCDACDRSGAVSLRGRGDPTETVEVTLPKSPPGEEPPSSKSRGLVMRIPDRGGPPPFGQDLPRGNLLLSVREGDEPSRGVARLAGPSIPPPPPPEILAPRVAPARAAPRGSRARLLAWAVAAVALFLVLWWFHR